MCQRFGLPVDYIQTIIKMKQQIFFSEKSTIHFFSPQSLPSCFDHLKICFAIFCPIFLTFFCNDKIKSFQNSKRFDSYDSRDLTQKCMLMMSSNLEFPKRRKLRNRKKCSDLFKLHSFCLLKKNPREIK